ncbi:MAG: hypothetical protein IBX68_10690, partial [Dehalococcoidia bacterium]|nr:hypothetical protein [Dehalococcoidia bacterium]
MRYIIGLLVAVTLLALVILPGCEPARPPGAEEISLGQAISLSRNEDLERVSVEMDKGWMVMTGTEGQEWFAFIGGMNTADLQEMGFVFPDDFSVSRGAAGDSGGSSLLAFLPLLFLVLLVFLLFRGFGMSRSQPGQTDFGRSKAKLISGSTPGVTFSDVAGIPEAKQDLLEVVDFLKHTAKYQMIGARIPKGVLLVGP